MRGHNNRASHLDHHRLNLSVSFAPHKMSHDHYNKVKTPDKSLPLFDSLLTKALSTRWCISHLISLQCWPTTSTLSSLLLNMCSFHSPLLSLMCLVDILFFQKSKLHPKEERRRRVLTERGLMMMENRYIWFVEYTKCK
jgi:hypothetical protein